MTRTRTGLAAALVVAGILAPLNAFAQQGVDQQINDAVKPYADAVSG